MVSLTDEMRHALAEYPERPVFVEDADTRQQYVLMRAELFQQIQPLIEAGELTDEEMLAAAAVANQGPEGWDAPGMEVYDGPEYDAPCRSFNNEFPTRFLSDSTCPRNRGTVKR